MIKRNKPSFIDFLFLSNCIMTTPTGCYLGSDMITKV